MIMVPMDAEGVSYTPIRNLGDANINAVYLDKVRVPVGNLVGKENGGWRMITTQLNHERIALMMVGPLARLSASVREYAREAPHGDGRKLLDLPWVRRNLALVEAKLEGLRLLNWRQAWSMGRGHLTMEEASGIKVYGSEFYVEAYRALLEILGVQGMVKRDSPAVLLRGELERHYRANPGADLRRRRQRSAARHHRDGRSAAAAGHPLTRSSWIGPPPKCRRRSASWRRTS